MGTAVDEHKTYNRPSQPRRVGKGRTRWTDTKGRGWEYNDDARTTRKNARMGYIGGRTKKTAIESRDIGLKCNALENACNDKAQGRDRGTTRRNKSREGPEKWPLHVFRAAKWIALCSLQPRALYHDGSTISIGRPPRQIKRIMTTLENVERCRQYNAAS
eukprot:scaffold24_cov341-Pavlova_lutheri.AAC.7